MYAKITNEKSHDDDGIRPDNAKANNEQNKKTRE